MAQRSTTRAVFWGLRFIVLAFLLVLAYRAFKAQGYVGLIGILFSVVLGLLWSYPSRQGEKLAAENMKKAGLQPDRD